MHWSSKGGKVQKLPPRWGLRSSQLVHLPTPFVLFRSNLWWFCNVHEKKSKLISDLSKFISQVSHDFMFDSKCPCLAAYVPWQTLNLELVSRILPGCSWDLQSWRCWEVDVHKAPMSWWPNLQNWHSLSKSCDFELNCLLNMSVFLNKTGHMQVSMHWQIIANPWYLQDISMYLCLLVSV